MKIQLILLFLLLTNAVLGQQILYVNADNGLIVRERPFKNAPRTGKLEYGTSVQIIQETDIALKIKDGTQNLNGKWVEVEEIGGHQKGYVFNGYLTPNRLIKRIEIKFDELVLQMELEVWDAYGDLKNIQKDTAKVYLELGDTPEGKKVKIKQSNFKNIEVFQRHENSVTIMNEGPHCDLTEWKHYYSEWKKLDFNYEENSFVSHTYERDDWEKFGSVDINELKRVVAEVCGDYWPEHIKDIQSVHEYPSGVSMSRIFLKIMLTDENDRILEKTISFEIPMGC